MCTCVFIYLFVYLFLPASFYQQGFSIKDKTKKKNDGKRKERRLVSRQTGRAGGQAEDDEPAEQQRVCRQIVMWAFGIQTLCTDFFL